MKHFLIALLLWPLLTFAGPVYLLECEGCGSPVARLELRNYVIGDTMYRYNFRALEVFHPAGTFVLDETAHDLEYGNDNNGVFQTYPSTYHFKLSGNLRQYGDQNDIGVYFESGVDGSWAFGFTADCPPIVVEGPDCIFNPRTNPGAGIWLLENQAIPEPGTLLLVILIGLILIGRRHVSP